MWFPYSLLYGICVLMHLQYKILICSPLIWLTICFPGRFTQVQEQYSEAFGTINDQKQLITQLEEDLRNVNALSVMFRGDAEVRTFPLSW